MSRLFFLLVFCCLVSVRLDAQSSGSVFPSLSGQTLLDSVSSHYRPTMVLDYAHARDTLFAKVLAKDDDTLRCIYTGYGLYLDPTQDPTQYVYLNGSTNGMNTEHAYPQAKGASVGTNAHSDMHHLFPARSPVNEARADKPFADIPDAQTQKWFISNQVYSSIPTQNINLYAESNANAFEPRESVKGDLARAIFYFYTVYRNQANAADPNFFELQRPTLCQWDRQDPADAAELTKTWRIAAYQENKPNPYIVDCTLANRTWCPTVPASCSVGTNDVVMQQSLKLQVLPNPVSGPAYLSLTLPFSGQLRGRVWSTLGQEIATFEWADAAAGTIRLPFELPQNASVNGWLGFLQVQLDGPNGHRMQTIPLVVTGF